MQIILIHLLLILPFAGFLISMVVPKKNETVISRLALGTFCLHLVLFSFFLALWAWNGFPEIDFKDFSLYSTKGYDYFIDFHFDAISATYLGVGSVLTFLVAMYSRVYLHREEGFKRFFNTILFFFFGYNLIIMAGNLETLFVGWEILGVSSFLLIAFYRDRFLPVRNAMKAYSVYRLGDIGLIIAMWMSHHLWHENIRFIKLEDVTLVSEHLDKHSWVGITISLMILMAAAVKSAQLPFSSWLPRAMEGPTPSSAIFYGSLSVHLGAFLLLRLMPFWEHQLSVRILIGVLGGFTALIAVGIARVQSTVKSQIAYASIAQIGIIFIEIALGLKTLALFHFAGNAFLRTYQLLVSPSVVSYLIREQVYHFTPQKQSFEDSWPRRIQYALYILCLKEWRLDDIIRLVYYRPVELLGKSSRGLTGTSFWAISIILFLFGTLASLFQNELPKLIHDVLPVFLAIFGLLMVARSFQERKSVATSWGLILFNHFWIALAISNNELIGFEQIALYLGGIVFSGFVGFGVISILKQKEKDLNLDRYQGHSYESPKLAFVFLLACLGLTGFPLTPAFIGEDLIFSHIHADQVALVVLVSGSLIIDGLAVMRIYTKVFLGHHVHNPHENAFKSS
jgi:NADH:ubiquinone oxidoreductase subunit 5 (subunit L)/multisubunit Na+/H+ antiporter MnhA subunit